jgi:glucoamylase
VQYASIGRHSFWSFNSPARTVKRGHKVRITAFANFRLHWSADNWQTINDVDSAGTQFGIHFVDVAVPESPSANITPVRFTFFWTESGKWEGRDFEIAVT